MKFIFVVKIMLSTTLWLSSSSSASYLKQNTISNDYPAAIKNLVAKYDHSKLHPPLEVGEPLPPEEPYMPEEEPYLPEEDPYLPEQPYVPEQEPLLPQDDPGLPEEPFEEEPESW